MPMPKRTSVQDYFDKLAPDQRPHLQQLRELSLATGPETREALKYNLPVYVRGDKDTSLWMLQNFKHHCSLRLPPRFFASYIAEVKAAGFDTGAGFVKLPYSSELPVELCRSLMQARVDEFEATGAGWSED